MHGSIVAGDFNQDGKLDLPVRQTTANAVLILIGNGMKRFKTNAQYKLSATPNSLVSADFNGDGLAIVQALDGPVRDAIRVLKQNCPVLRDQPENPE